MKKRIALLLLLGLGFVSCASVPKEPGVASDAIRKGLVGTWENNSGSGIQGNRVKKRYLADGTAESWLTTSIRIGSRGAYSPPSHLTSRWRVEGDTVVMWDYKENGVPSKEHTEYRDKIVFMSPEKFVFYSFDHAAERPATVYRTNKSIADPF